MTPAALLARIQDRVLIAFGRAPRDRTEIVRGMLEPRGRGATGYWLQLAIATILATLGLALNSTAVVIGAMLIAPLMRPLVELAMGLATGSATLVLHAVVRTVASIIVVVTVSIAISWALPFHTFTAELAARTAPTLLDLVIAAGCALAAAYAALRKDAEIVTTAAGTSIGISLVPPLCAAGYAIALSDATATRGAALLFTANLSGILAVAAAVFVLVGFTRVDVRHEEDELEHAGVVRGRAARIGRAYSRLASPRLGPVSRMVPPLLLLGIVYVPLANALREIAHRNQISHTIEDLFGQTDRRVVDYTLDQTASTVVVRAVVVGDAHDASQLDAEIRRRLTVLDVRAPHVSVWAVPDAAEMSALAHRIDDIPPPPAPEPAPKTVHRYSSDLASAARDVWPKQGTGALVRVWLDADHPGHLRVVHLGAPLGDAGTALLARALEPTAGTLAVDEIALSPVDADAAGGAAWLPRAIQLADDARRIGSLDLCVTLPVPPPAKRRGAAPPPSDIPTIRTAIQASLQGIPGVSVRDGDRWRIEAATTPCDTPPPPP